MNDIKSLISFEKKNKLWDIKFLKYPVWIHCRETFIGLNANRKIFLPNIFSLLKSALFTIYFLVWKQHFVNKIYFLMDREELLYSYQEDNEEKKILFLNYEQNGAFNGKHISADFLNIFRFLCRKLAFLIFFPKYQKIIHKTPSKNCNKNNIKTALGDALWLRILALILKKSTPKYYSGCVIPMGEKFLNLLNSNEVQHGVIHPNHVGYINVPKVLNTLIVYHEKYKSILAKNNYDGKILVNNYKENFLTKNTNRFFEVVIYTQPIPKMQNDLNDFLKNTRYINSIYIQKHPKDYFIYDIPDGHLVSKTIPSEVKYPIAYCSSTIENFTLQNKQVYIWDIKDEKINLDDILQVFGECFIICTSLDLLFAKFKEDELL